MVKFYSSKIKQDLKTIKIILKNNQKTKIIDKKFRYSVRAESRRAESNSTTRYFRNDSVPNYSFLKRKNYWLVFQIERWKIKL